MKIFPFSNICLSQISSLILQTKKTSHSTKFKEAAYYGNALGML